MLNKIIQFSLQNRLFILIASVLLMIGGLYQAYHTEVDVFPDLNAPTVVVMTEAGGMAAEEVEQLVTFPIETAVNGATSVRRVRSSSTTSLSYGWNSTGTRTSTWPVKSYRKSWPQWRKACPTMWVTRLWDRNLPFWENCLS